MIGQVYSKKDVSSHTCNKKTTEIGHSDQHIGQTIMNRNNYPNAFKAKQAPVLSFDNPAHQRR
jgi:hypothetical protein